MKNNHSVFKILTIGLILLLSSQLLAVHNQYKIYFSAYPHTINAAWGNDWLEGIKKNWDATGVQLYVLWDEVKPSESNPYDFSEIDDALDEIIADTLDINILVPMGLHLPDWVDFQLSASSSPDGLLHSGSMHIDDFHLDHNGDHIFKGCNKWENRYLNLTSPNAIDTMKSYYTAVVTHIKDYCISNSINRSNVEIIPSVSLNAEMELNTQWKMTGYSSHEKNDITGFRKFLQNRYTYVSTLKSIWEKSGDGPTITTWTSINPSNYNWNEKDLVYKDDYNYPNGRNYEYDYPKGRLDWLEFKQKQINKLFNQFSTITTNAGFEVGLQIGCLHDYLLDYRGFLDPTPLLEKAHALRLADVANYQETFAFSADYARSMCEYWDENNSFCSRRGFSSETNWYLYGVAHDDISSLTYNEKKSISQSLSAIWADQVQKYYERGGDMHNVLGWGNSGAPAQFWYSGSEPSSYTSANKTDMLVWNNNIINSSTGWYRTFIAKLNNVKNDSRLTKTANNAIHLSIDYFSSMPNRNDVFYLANAVKSKSFYSEPQANYQEIGYDIITNYMIKKNPTYLHEKSYYYLSLTESSSWLSDTVYYNLMKEIVDPIMRNSTRYYNSNRYVYYKTQGIKNEYGDTRSPIHLIWRSRQDLMELFPEANQADPVVASQKGWDTDNDFIYWAKEIGQYSATNWEYPDWDIYDASADEYFYDENIKKAWDDRSYLWDIFDDAHYKSSSCCPELNNMIDWMILYGPSSNYENWPYIGDGYISKRNSETFINSAIPTEFTLNPNYPNPFNPTTTINFDLPNEVHVTLNIYDITGRLVSTLVNKKMLAGSHSINWEGLDENGVRVPSGIYLCKIVAGEFSKTIKMSLIK